MWIFGLAILVCFVVKLVCAFIVTALESELTPKQREDSLLLNLAMVAYCIAYVVLPISVTILAALAVKTYIL